MRRFTMMILLLSMLVVGGGRTCVAQPTQTDAADVLPWFHLRPEKRTPGFQSIIGDPQTQIVPGSQSATCTDPTLSITLPFDILFLGTVYHGGMQAHVSVGGFFSFNQATGTGIWPYLLAPDSIFCRMLMPFWSDLRTTGSSEGIYQRLETTTGGDSIWTIEWSVETMSEPASAGAFQLKITRLADWSACGMPVARFEYLYDAANPIDRGQPAKFGAVVGIKNLGQDVGVPPPLNAGADDNKYLIMVPSGADTPYVSSITRLPTRRHNVTDNVPDYYTTSTVPASPYFHDGTPTDSNYRMTPIEADVSAVRKGEAESTDVVFPSGNYVVDVIGVLNYGTSTVDHVPIYISITRNGSTTRDTIYADTVKPWGDTVFASFPVWNNQPGEYHVTAVAHMSGDEDRSNDSAAWTYFVSPTYDAMATAITSPLLQDPATTARYVTGTSIPIDAVFSISGTSHVNAVFGRWEIRDASGAYVTGGIDTISASALTVRSDYAHHFGSFLPTAPGLYYVKVVFRSDSDQLPADDSLVSIPYRDWLSHGPGNNVRGARPIPFEVFAPIDLAAGQPGAYPQLPFPEDTIHGRTGVMEIFLNKGGNTTTRSAHVRIVDPTGKVVYLQRLALPSITGGRRIRTQYFPTFSPIRNGMYRITAWLERDSADADSTNDSASWRFWVVLDTGDARGRSSGSGGELSYLNGTLAPCIGTSSDGVMLFEEKRRIARVPAAGLLDAVNDRR